ncbi:MAG TPA: phosphoribosylanthranilate isomerase [bacterium]|nr:phosphoribosylanthranilate isomerase [bacterium]
MIRAKICCISSEAEARIAVRHGASLLGFVSAMPSGPGVVDEDTIARVVPTVPVGVTTVLLTSRVAAADIAEQQRRCGTQAIQLVDAPEAGALAALRRVLPGIRLLQVIHVRGPGSVDEARAAAADAHALLLDSGNPDLARKELGGTGRVHDWSISRRIVESVSVPVFLAGGLTPENVEEAIDRVRPFGVDVCSGVRTDGDLDEDKVSRFLDAARCGV